MGKAWRMIPSALLVIAGVAAAIYYSRPAPEPVYKGKPLQYWLSAYTNRSMSVPAGAPIRSEADEAVRQIGTNAVPTLLELLQARDLPLERRFLALLRKLHLTAIPYTPAWTRNTQAVAGFFALGAKARTAVPRLMEIYDRAPEVRSQLYVTFVLGLIGPAAKDAVPLLVRATTHQNDSVRNNAVCSLGLIHSAPAASVPALIPCLRDPSPTVRATAAHSLAAFGKDAQTAVPALLGLLRDEKSRNLFSSVGTNMPAIKLPPGLNASLAEAIWEIDPNTAAKWRVQRPSH
jgi:HEAT repeat protein